MTLPQVFSDILDHTHGLGFIDMVKIVSEGTETKIEAMDQDKTVVVYGKLANKLAELDGVVGLSRMAVLQGYLKFPPFLLDKAKVEIVTQKRGTDNVPAEIKFSSPDGHDANYRFMGKDVAEEQIKVPLFKGVDWDVVVVPTKENMDELGYFNGVLGSFEPVFTAKTDGKDLNLYIGSGATDRAMVPFAKGVSGTLKGNLSWPLVETLAILKLAAKAEDCTMSFSNKGALRIEMSTEIGAYEYILPARSR